MSNINLMFVCRHIHNGGTIEPWHTHSCHELVYYVSGKGNCRIGEDDFSYSDNQILYIPPHKKHEERHDTTTEVIFFGFDFDNTDFKISEGIYKDDGKKRLLKLFMCINDEIKNKKSMYQYAVNLDIGNVLLALHRQKHKGNNGNILENCLEFASNYVKMHIQQKINVYDLAKASGYSYDYFRHEFLTKYGISPKAFILNEKITHAKKQLRETDDTVSSISQKYSFDSPSHFIRSFKYVVGCSPVQYRKKWQEFPNDIEVKYGK